MIVLGNLEPRSWMVPMHLSSPAGSSSTGRVDNSGCITSSAYHCCKWHAAVFVSPASHGGHVTIDPWQLEWHIFLKMGLFHPPQQTIKELSRQYCLFIYFVQCCDKKGFCMEFQWLLSRCQVQSHVQDPSPKPIWGCADMLLCPHRPFRESGYLRLLLKITLIPQ